MRLTIIEISLSDSPKIFQLPGKMAAQALRYRNTAGQELSVGKFDASFKRAIKCGQQLCSPCCLQFGTCTEQSIKGILLGPQGHTPDRHSIPREYQFRLHSGDRFNNGYQPVMRSWHQDQIQAANIDPVLYIQPHIKYLAEYLFWISHLALHVA